MTPAEYRIECEVAAEVRDDLARRIVHVQCGSQPGSSVPEDDTGDDGGAT